MWLTAPNRMGDAAWVAGDSAWRVLARGGADGVRIDVGGQSVSLLASDGGTLPQLDEQFVRGDQLHFSFPQVDGRDEFGFRLVLRPVLCNDASGEAGRVAFEVLVSIQTTLLDSHPTLDLVLPATDHPESLAVDSVVSAVHFAAENSLHSAVLLGPHDAPFTSLVPADGQLRLRLFGEFLEKGVIRRARPWLILDRSGMPIEASAATEWWHQLAGSPLPLA